MSEKIRLSIVVQWNRRFAGVAYYYNRKSKFYTLPHKYTSNKLDFL